MNSKKTMSRLAAVQAIYQFEINDKQQTTSELCYHIQEFYKDKESLNDTETGLSDIIKFNEKYFNALVENTVTNINDIDNIIDEHLTENWQIKKLDATVLSILRVGICELKYFPETPFKVVVNEYTNIANDLAKEQDIGFVNSLLHTYSQGNS